jgi:hypothetical protein
MTRTTHAPRPTVDRPPADPLTQMWQTTSDVTRYVIDAYTTGLNIVLEQQRAMQQASERWLNDIVDLGSRTLAEAESEAREVTARAAEPARREPARREPARRPARATPRTARRRAVTPTAKSAVARAVGPALATWTPEGYDTLTAAEVNEKLARFSQSELREVLAYEQAHQARTTILQRIEALQGEEPVPGYDGLPVPEVERRLAAGDAPLATRVRDYERAHKNRDGVLRAVEAQLA